MTKEATDSNIWTVGRMLQGACLYGKYKTIEGVKPMDTKCKAILQEWCNKHSPDKDK